MEKYKTEWNLGLLYKSDKDPQIEKDMQAIEKACTDFEKKYRGKDFISTPQKLLNALEDSEKLSEKMMGSKPWWYFALKTDLNSDDAKAGASATRFEQRLTNASNRMTFFSLKIADIPKKGQEKMLKEKILKPYNYQLKRIFSGAKYKLSEGEEQLEDLLSQMAYTMWIDGQQKLLTQQTVDYKKESIPISKATSIIKDLSKEERYRLHKTVNEKLKSISYFAESEINAVYNYKKIMDERRGYAEPFSATILGYENEEKTIESLISTVTKYFTISRSFYKLQARLLKEKKITLADRSVKIGDIKKKFDFETSISIVRNAFKKVDQKYADYLDSFLKNGQLDVYPKKGKKGGAYCWGTDNNPTFILLNHTDNIRSVETLAHEMGHAIHTELSKTQPKRYQKYSTATAEVASTFFEQLVTDELENILSEREKIILLHNKILGDVATIFRQVACFNFELELHQKIRKEGQVSKENIAKLMAMHFRSYLGNSVEVTDDDGYFFVDWSHIRRFFYVYSYAFGQMVSKSLYENWKKDPSYAAKVEEFLRAGRSMSPEDIFKKASIDVTNPAFFETGLKAIESDIKKLESLAKKQKLI